MKINIQLPSGFRSSFTKILEKIQSALPLDIVIISHPQGHPFIVLVTAFLVPTEKEVRFLSNQHNLFITNLISFQDDYQFPFNEYCTNIQFIGC